MLEKFAMLSEVLLIFSPRPISYFFFFNDTATTEIYTLSLHDALPIYLVHQQTQNQRYGSSHIGATAKDISNVVTDAASGVVDIFHGIDKAVADTWNNF